MFKLRLNLKTQQYYQRVKAEENKRMHEAVRVVNNEVKRLLSVKVGKEGKEVTERSEEGEPARLETGRLRTSMATEVKQEGEKVVGYVGTNVQYAKYLEDPEGLNRAFLEPALRAMRRTVNRILIGKKIQ